MATKKNPDKYKNGKSGKRPIPGPAELLKRAGLQPGSRVVDLGCGLEGKYALAAAELVGPDGKVVVLAREEQHLDALKVKGTPGWLETVVSKDFISNSVDGAFDFGVMAYTFHTIKGMAPFLTEVNRIFSVGARLLVVDWRKVDDGCSPPKKVRLARGDAEAFLERAGFDVEDAEFLDSSNYFVLAVKERDVKKVNLYGER